MNILETIIKERQADVARSMGKVPVEILAQLVEKRTYHRLAERLKDDSEIHVIAEMKKASPSAGLLRENYCPAEIAREYEKHGATAISVLTEPRHFLGSNEHLRAVREAVKLPLLRKDFIVDPYQVYESAAYGADIVLLIAAVLCADKLRMLYDKSRECGLEVIVEVHTEEELGIALELEKAIIGVNSRNLKTLKTDLSVAMSLAGSIPRERLSIAESGIRNRADIEMLTEAGYNAFLVGEALMTDAGEPGRQLAALVRPSI